MNEQLKIVRKMLNFSHSTQTHADTQHFRYVDILCAKIGSFYCKSFYCCCVCFQSSFGHKTDFKKLFFEDTVRRILCRKKDRSKWKEFTLSFTYDLYNQAKKLRLPDKPTYVLICMNHLKIWLSNINRE